VVRVSKTFLARDRFDESVEFRRIGDTVEYRYTKHAYDNQWRVPTWEIREFTPTEQAAYRAALLA